jgi:hypothetical protein
MYSNTGNEPTWAATGSAHYLTTVPLKRAFDRQPHITYVVFRDKQRNRDHVVAFDAAGDLTVAQGSVAVTDEARLFLVVDVQPAEPAVSVSLKPKPVELLALGSSNDEPRITVSSDGKVRLKHPSTWHRDNAFGLDEVKSIHHTKGLTGGGEITFALAEGSHSVSYASKTTAAEHHAELERLVKPMAPHVQLSSGRNWWMIALIVFLAVVAGGVVTVIVVRASKK